MAGCIRAGAVQCAGAATHQGHVLRADVSREAGSDRSSGNWMGQNAANGHEQASRPGREAMTRTSCDWILSLPSSSFDSFGVRKGPSGFFSPPTATARTSRRRLLGSFIRPLFVTGREVPDTHQFANPGPVTASPLSITELIDDCSFSFRRAERGKPPRGVMRSMRLTHEGSHRGWRASLDPARQD